MAGLPTAPFPRPQGLPIPLGWHPQAIESITVQTRASPTSPECKVSQSPSGGTHKQSNRSPCRNVPAPRHLNSSRSARFPCLWVREQPAGSIVLRISGWRGQLGWPCLGLAPLEPHYPLRHSPRPGGRTSLAASSLPIRASPSPRRYSRSSSSAILLVREGGHPWPLLLSPFGLPPHLVVIAGLPPPPFSSSGRADIPGRFFSPHSGFPLTSSL